MYKLFRAFNAYSFRPTFTDTAKVLCVATERRKVNLFLEYNKNKREKSRKKHHWKYNEHLRLVPLFLPFGLSLAACNAQLKHKEKRFFRSVLYGLENEVQR